MELEKNIKISGGGSLNTILVLIQEYLIHTGIDSGMLIVSGSIYLNLKNTSSFLHFPNSYLTK